jgi:hypothetical protein
MTKEMNNRTLANKLVPLLSLVFVLGLYACAGASRSPSSLKLPSTSPAKVVDGYLGALEKADFVKTYDFISPAYAGNLDKESYRINMEQGLVKKYNWSLLDFEIKGVRIVGSQAFVVAELGVQFKPLNSENQVQRKIEIQYVLAALDNKWKITSDSCISNCQALDDTTSQGLRPGNFKSLEFK